MKYFPSDWLDIMAMRVEGAASSWVNTVLQDVAVGRKAPFLTWRSFTQAMIHRFEPVIEVEEARKQLRALRQPVGSGATFKSLRNCNITYLTCKLRRRFMHSYLG